MPTHRKKLLITAEVFRSVVESEIGLKGKPLRRVGPRVGIRGQLCAAFVLAESESSKLVVNRVC